MKYQLLVLSVFLLFFYSGVFGQKAYIFTDSTFKSGLNVIDKGNVANSAACYVQVGPNVKIYYPGEIKGYGLADGTKFIASEIEINGAKQMVFLKLLSDGKAKLYSYTDYTTKLFFVQKDSSDLVFLSKPIKNSNKQDYKEQIKLIVSDNTEIAGKKVIPNYSALPLFRYFRAYNFEGSELPKTKIILTTSVKFTGLFYDSPYKIYDKFNTPPDKKDIPLNKFKYTYEPGISLGLQIEKPFWESKYSVLTGVYYSKNKFEYTFLDGLNSGRFNASIQTLNFPAFIKYTFSEGKLRPYINAGCVFEFNLINHNSFNNVIKNSGGTIVSNITTHDHISKKMLGFDIGGGVSIKINKKNSMIFELRMGKAYGSSSYNTLYQNEIQLVTGFCF